MSFSLQQFVNFIDKYMLEIFIVTAVTLVVLFLARSFRRSLLIEKGRARFVLEHYDTATEKLHKWVAFFIIFMLLPLFGYVKFLGS